MPSRSRGAPRPGGSTCGGVRRAGDGASRGPSESGGSVDRIERVCEIRLLVVEGSDSRAKADALRHAIASACSARSSPGGSRAQESRPAPATPASTPPVSGGTCPGGRPGEAAHPHRCRGLPARRRHHRPAGHRSRLRHRRRRLLLGEGCRAADLPAARPGRGGPARVVGGDLPPGGEGPVHRLVTRTATLACRSSHSGPALVVGSSRSGPALVVALWSSRSGRPVPVARAGRPAWWAAPAAVCRVRNTWRGGAVQGYS